MWWGHHQQKSSLTLPIGRRHEVPLLATGISKLAGPISKQQQQPCIVSSFESHENLLCREPGRWGNQLMPLDQQQHQQQQRSLVIRLSLSSASPSVPQHFTNQNSTASSWAAYCHHLMQMATNLNHLESCVPRLRRPAIERKRHLVLLTCITPVRPSANTVPTPKSLKKKFAVSAQGPLQQSARQIERER